MSDTPIRRTKIVATMGPASSDPASLRAMLEAGVDVIRLNLSHGTVKDHLERLALVRSTADALDKVVAVLADLPGPKIRAGAFPSDGAALAEGSSVVFTYGTSVSTSERVEVDYPALTKDLGPGDKIIVGDGAISARIIEVNGDSATAIILTGGRVAGRPGVHLPSTRTRLETPTARDLELAVTMAEAGVDFLAVSFVGEGSDMRQVRSAVSSVASPPRLVAKIETSHAMENLSGILRESDAIMVARGDLGIDCDLADVPHIQKRLIRTCVEEGIPVITATQMLESMITAPTPTRAEVSDVANAVFDGTDAVMLSAETAVGHDPALVVKTMSEICMRAESQASYRQWASRLGRIQRAGRNSNRSIRITEALTHAAWQAVEDIGAEAIVCCTRSGGTARSMARFRPLARLIAASPSSRSVRTLALSWGVIPIRIDEQKTADDMIWVAVEQATKLGLVSSGELVVALAGTRAELGSPIDLARIIEIH